MPFQKKTLVPINYTDRDFESIKNALVEHARRYYPDTYKDFSEAGFGSMMMDSVSYIGDMLSFYLDYQANESFLETAIEYKNVVKLARQMGYKLPVSSQSTGTLTMYVVVPALSAGYGPDEQYIPLLRRGSQFTAPGGAVFTLAEDVDFAAAGNEMVVAAANSTTGAPTKFAIKAHGQVISGELAVQTITVGAYEKFLNLRLNSANVTEIVSVIDSNGHEYYEVDYLAQNVIYRPVVNKADDKDKVPFIVKPFTVPRRFVVERSGRFTHLQFGYGSESNLNTEKVVDPSKVILQLHAKEYITERSFDPSALIETDKMGVVPSNTDLRVLYRTNTANNVNAASKQITEVLSPIFYFKNEATLTTSELRAVISSLEVENEEPITGDISAPTADEVKHRAYGTFYSQNRAVTAEDYKSLIYKMPSKLGSIKRVNILKDSDSFKRNLNIYLISEDEKGKLIETSRSAKQNIKTWLNSHKLMNDTVDLMDAKIVNIGVQFEIISDFEKNKFNVLQMATRAVRTRMARIPMDIAEPFRITNVFNILKNVEGVLDVTDVKIQLKVGGAYSDAFYDLDANTSPDGRLLYVPENVIIEIKYPNTDIEGTVR